MAEMGLQRCRLQLTNLRLLLQIFHGEIHMHAAEGAWLRLEPLDVLGSMVNRSVIVGANRVSNKKLRFINIELIE